MRANGSSTPATALTLPAYAERGPKMARRRIFCGGTPQVSVLCDTVTVVAGCVGPAEMGLWVIRRAAGRADARSVVASGPTVRCYNDVGGGQ
jgi:hypothetical protein